MRTLIIGYGSPIRGDDALGPLAADRLGSADLPDHVQVISRHILTAELVADLVDKERVIFLDASVDAEPGEVRCRRLEPDSEAVSTMAHFLDPRELLAWCQTLYGRAPESYLVSAGISSLDYASYQLTPIAESALERMLEAVDRLVAEPNLETVDR
ncbi:hydrogenase maturation protease [Imhoffiella purpurea]|uniref:NADH-reducing hydrogenase maturation factor n=1 Tax=Imhoffiella purpurea TaxID=1249627 RepID=W9VLJ1_9GAMM|nr:hydrogenase maturation protease [Imhoffiella purpurea]EXJ16972.1 NADH-reducing hydrogenase maturation factor [Imhoffiella purpurea]